jgi:hypothetical protein
MSTGDFIAPANVKVVQEFADQMINGVSEANRIQIEARR